MVTAVFAKHPHVNPAATQHSAHTAGQGLLQVLADSYTSKFRKI